MTQKQLGIMIGFPERSADIRIAQYEAGIRTPKTEITKKIAKALEVSPRALNAPELDDNIGLMHTLFVLEDMHGFEISKIDGEVCLRINHEHKTHRSMSLIMQNWYHQRTNLENGVISKEEYETWKSQYPQSDTVKYLKDHLFSLDETEKELSE